MPFEWQFSHTKDYNACITQATKKSVTHFVSYQLRSVLGFNVHRPYPTVCTSV